MEYKKILINEIAFGATTQDLNISADHVKYLDIGILGRQCGSVACSFGTLGATLDEILIQLGGEHICSIHFRDLIVLNHIWEDIYPHLLLGAGAGNFCAIEGVRLPLHVSKCGKSLSVVFTFVAKVVDLMQDAASQLLCCAYQYRDKPFASHFNYQYKEHQAAAAATWYEIPLDYAGAELIGVLIYNPVIPTVTVRTTAIDEVKISVDDREIYHESWETMTKLHANVDTPADIIWGPEVDMYRWLDFQQEALPAGKLRLHYMTEVDTGHIARFIPVYIQKNQAQ